MTGDELITKVLKTVQDPSIEEGEVLDLLNEGLLEVAGRVLLPYLETTADVDTVVDEFQVVLPTNYQHGLFDCQDVARDLSVTVLNSKRQLLAKYGRMTYVGDVRHVCAPPGGFLLYNPVPVEAKTLTISFYEFPTQLTKNTSPDCLPAQFHKILWRYASFTLFDDIEDGITGENPNTRKHEGKYEGLITGLQLFYKEGQSRPKPPITLGEYM